MKEDNLTLMEKVLACPQCVVSVMRDHGGEGVDYIFNRKKADIERTGKTFWFMRSPKAQPRHVQVVLRHQDLKTTQAYLGKVSEGWKNLIRILAKERIFSAAMSTGGSRTVLESLVKFVKERKVAGTPPGKFQSIAHKISDISIAVTAARLLTYDAAYEADHQSYSDSIKPSMAKTFAGENWISAAQEGMEIMGSFGYLPEYGMERFLGDARLATIAGGTAEIQRNIIAKGLGL
jgi:alkylation response protein AidB-like acyl-CoA dehydrogenase